MKELLEVMFPVSCVLFGVNFRYSMHLLKSIN